MSRPLEKYQSMRDFKATAEPRGRQSTVQARAGKKRLQFVIQKHAASHLHFDLRLELDGVMKSWAVPKGPSCDPAVKRLAMEVEDHPVEYNTFEGTIPKGQYGGGTVMLWDKGTYEPDEKEAGEDSQKAVRRGLRSGKLAFTFHGERLKGSFALVRTKSEDRPQWILLKHRDEFARPGSDIVSEVSTSVESGRTMEQIASGDSKVWHSDRAADDVADIVAMFEDSEITPMLPTDAAELGDGIWAIEPFPAGTRILGFAANGVGRVVAVDGRAPVPAATVKKAERELTRISRNRSTPLVLDALLTDSGDVHALDLLVNGPRLALDAPYIERRLALEAALGAANSRVLTIPPLLLVTQDDVADAVQGDEVLLARRIDSEYRSGESEEWVRLSSRGRSRTAPARKVRVAKVGSSAGASGKSSIIPTDAIDATVSADGLDVAVTNLNKVFWEDLGITKGDLLRYYDSMAPVLLPHLRDRAMVMKRYPHGASGEFFFMKRAPTPRPEWIETCSITHSSASVIDFPMVQDLASLLWVINLGCIDLNPWYARCDDVDRPDYLHFDLDQVPGATFDRVRETALHLRELLQSMNLPTLAKTSGSKGIHVYIPIVRGPKQKEVWTLAKKVAKAMEAKHPKLVTAEYRIAKRPANRVLVDYNQNAWGRTLASIYSVRPKPLATVSAPVTWEEVESGVTIEQFTLRNMPSRVAQMGDLWASLLSSKGRADIAHLL